MNRLVEMKNGEPKTTSNLIGEEFGIAHKHVLETIRKLAVEISTARFNSMYQPFTRNSRGKEYPSYYVNSDGYMFYVMNISTKKANSKKLAFIDAFGAMNEALKSTSPILDELNELTKLVEADKANASNAGSILAKYRKVKPKNKRLVDSAFEKVQLSLGF